MSVTVKNLIDFLRDFHPEDKFCVDDGGLALIHIDGNEYIEIGGLPEEETVQE